MPPHEVMHTVCAECTHVGISGPAAADNIGLLFKVQLNTFYPSQIDTQQHVHMHVHVRKYAVGASEGRPFIRLDLLLLHASGSGHLHALLVCMPPCARRTMLAFRSSRCINGDSQIKSDSYQLVEVIICMHSAAFNHWQCNAVIRFLQLLHSITGNRDSWSVYLERKTQRTN